MLAGAKAFDPVLPRLTIRQNNAQGAIIADNGFAGPNILIQAKDPAGDEAGGDPNHPTPSGIFKLTLKNLDSDAEIAVTPAIAAAGERFVERPFTNLAEGRYQATAYDGTGNDTSVLFKPFGLSSSVGGLA